MDTWMSSLPDNLLDLPLTHLSIPGSHDSCSYPITSESPLSPDNDAFAILALMGNMGLKISSRWARTQDRNVTEQLYAGIRYFDLRVLRCLENEEIYFVHGQYAREMSSDLFNIRVYLKDHPQEVVILDFNHLYAFNPPTHLKKLEDTIVKIFNTMLAPPQENIPSIRKMRDNCHQVICFLHSSSPSNIFWPRNRITSPWPDTCDLGRLIEFLDMNPPEDRSLFHVTQGILTPNADFIVKHMDSGLVSLAKPAGERLMQWLNEEASRPKPNIVIIDFAVGLFANFATTVVNLNL